MRRLNGLFGAVALVVAAWGLGGAGCAALEDAGCSSDADCRFGRVCFEGACTGEASTGNNANSGTNVDPNNANNAFPNGDPNNVNANVGPNVDPNVQPNNSSIGQPCRPTGECGDNNICGPDGVCVPFCEDSGGCDGDDVCVVNGCVEPRECELVELGGDQFTCFAQWICEQGDVGVVCEGLQEEGGICFCFDSATGQSRDFVPEGITSCDSDEFLTLANSECGLRVPEGG